MAEHGNREQTYGIGAVAKLTGLSDHTIRVWERRYEAVVARRAPNGRRIYTSADVEKLTLLKQLTARGLAIGSIAGESRQELRQRLERMGELSASHAPSRIDAAVLGDFLPARIRSHRGGLEPLNVVIVETNPARFAADIRQHAVDLLVLELPMIDDDTATQLRESMAASGAKKAILVYSFAKSEHVQRLRDTGIVLLRAPATVDELIATAVRAYEARGKAQLPGRTQVPEPPDESWWIEGPIEPRRFTQEELAALSNVASAIDCECPRHLAELVGDLSAFEVYSASCASKDDDDAALHRYLQHTTARARVLIEGALQRVIEAEGLEY